MSWKVVLTRKMAIYGNRTNIRVWLQSFLSSPGTVFIMQGRPILHFLFSHFAFKKLLIPQWIALQLTFERKFWCRPYMYKVAILQYTKGTDIAKINSKQLWHPSQHLCFQLWRTTVMDGKPRMSQSKQMLYDCLSNPSTVFNTSPQNMKDALISACWEPGIDLLSPSSLFISPFLQKCPRGDSSLGTFSNHYAQLSHLF